MPTAVRGKMSPFEALDATGQQEKAQQLRWAAFEERLSSSHLRAYLKKMPDFDDVEAKERAMAHVPGFKDFSTALAFFQEWPDQNRAECSSLAPNIRDFGAFGTHDVFVARLRAGHGRKTGFWAQVTGSSDGRR
jgi:hypothetical protein